jgi:trans-aconitate methyltransferase
MSNELTNRQFWVHYWESKNDIVRDIHKDHMFSELLIPLCKTHQIKTAVEIGGFPGYFAVFLKKHCHVAPTIMDFFIHKDLSDTLMKANDIEPTDVKYVETDIFKADATIKYDLVLSCGLIEHFNDTKQIIEYHLPHLKQDGVLFITLPNFKGLNGWIQKIFDRANYDKHNISSMDIELLKKIAKELGLKNYSVNYYGKFSVWLEDENQKPLWQRKLVKAIWFVGKVFSKIIPFESKLLSPNIVLIGQK